MVIYKKGTFEASHILKNHSKCGRLHGHSYKYEVWIESKGKLTKDFGFVLDFHDISSYFKKFDHSGQTINISCEKLVENALNYFKKLLPHAKIKVRIWETETSYAEDEK